MSPYRGPASIRPAFEFPRTADLKSPDLWVRPFLLSLAVTLAVIVWVVIPAAMSGGDAFAEPISAK